MAKKATVGELLFALKADPTTLNPSISKALKSTEASVATSMTGVKASITNAFASSAQNASRSLSSMLGPLNGLAPASLAVSAAIGGIALAAKSGISAFTSLAGEVGKLKRATGASAEDSSRLVAALRDVGVSADKAAPALQMLAKNADSKAFTNLGIAVARTKDGTADLIGTLANVIAKANGIKDPIERANVLTAALGRQAATLGPLFSKGADGFRELLRANEGQVLSDADLRKAREYKEALRNLGDAARELEVSVGRFAVPAVTKLAEAGLVLADKIPVVVSALKSAEEEIATRFGDAVQTGEKRIQGLIGVLDVLAGPRINFSDDVFAHISTRADGATKSTKKLNDATEDLAGTSSEAAKASSTYADSLAKLNDALGLSVTGTAKTLQARLDAQRAAASLLEGQQAITRAKQDERDVTVAADRAIADADDKVNQIRAKSPGLLSAKTKAERDSYTAQLLLTQAIKDQKTAQGDYDRAVGDAPRKIQEVTDALNRQLDARQALDEFQADLTTLKDDKAASDEKIAALKANAPADQQAEVDARTKAFHDAQDNKAEVDRKLALAKQGRSDETDQLEQQLKDRHDKALADLNDPTLSQDRKNDIAKDANADQKKIQADVDDARKAALASVRGLTDDATVATDDLAKAQRNLNDAAKLGTQATRELNKELAHNLQLANLISKKTREEGPKLLGEANQADVNANAPAASFELDSPRGGPLLNIRPLNEEQKKASDTLTAAIEKTTDASDKAAQAQQGVVDATADITGNERDLKDAIRDRDDAEQTARKNRAAAHTEAMAAISAEKGAVQQYGIDVLTGLGKQFDRGKEVQGLFADVDTKFDNLLKAGGKTPDLAGLQAIKTSLAALGDTDDVKRVDAMITKLEVLNGLAGSNPGNPKTTAKTVDRSQKDFAEPTGPFVRTGGNSSLPGTQFPSGISRGGGGTSLDPITTGLLGAFGVDVTPKKGVADDTTNMLLVKISDGILDLGATVREGNTAAARAAQAALAQQAGLATASKAVGSIFDSTSAVASRKGGLMGIPRRP